MWNRKRALVGAIILATSVTACEDFLQGPELSTDPNRPSQANMDQLYHAVQLNQFFWHTADLARNASMWMQQMAGTDRQYINRDLYEITEDEFDGYFSGVYIGGGLVDIRGIQELAAASGDRTMEGVAKVWEAHLMGMAASLWGDIPYSGAVAEAEKPALDAQADVYAAVQTVLTSAIADLGSGIGAGPGALDLVYGGDASLWLEAAYTLKARFAMHWVETGNAAACGGPCLEVAISSASSGISSPANDFRAFFTEVPGEQNPWHQFMFVFRPGYLSAGRNLVDLLISRDDPRLLQYFRPIASGEVVGAPPATSITASMLSAERGHPGFDQPLITYAENELILAEAFARQGATGEASTHLNNARAAAGLGPISPAPAELLREIMLEKYIALFQNIEAWNDYKRTCIPELTPSTGSEIPGRLLYGSSERNVNPGIPAPDAQPARNPNDPAPCS
jgi:starch-binding outer membrane protein, SusD/RagB family